MANAHEAAARSKKIQKLEATIDALCAKLGCEVRSAAFAEFVAEQGADWWTLVSGLAGVRMPSDVTKAEVVAHYRERPILDAAVARLTAVPS